MFEGGLPQGALASTPCRGMAPGHAPQNPREGVGCHDHGWTIEDSAIQPDHVHLFIRAWPKDSAADVLKAVQGVPAHELRAKSPHLRETPSLWTRRATQRLLWDSAGRDPEPFPGKELRPTPLEANIPRTWGRLLS
ncbi:MAG: transposase [Planctomycetaceae bacterium]|nr:transposase [Planctomycetaceae bacterium]